MVVCWTDKNKQRLEKNWPSEILMISFIVILIRPWIILSLSLITNSQVYYPCHKPFIATLCLSFYLSLVLSTRFLSPHPFPFHIWDVLDSQLSSVNKHNSANVVLISKAAIIQNYLTAIKLENFDPPWNIYWWLKVYLSLNLIKVIFFCFFFHNNYPDIKGTKNADCVF